MRSGKLIFSLLAGLSLSPSTVHAQILAGGADQHNALPFGSGVGFAGLKYQQVYSSTLFSGVTNISNISFASAVDSATGTANYNITVGLSNTSKAVNGLSSNFESNKGANFTTVFSGILTPTILANNTFDLVIPTSGFTYNPASGNLLFDVVFNSTPTFPGPNQVVFVAGVAANSSRAGVSGGIPFTDNFSLRTRIGTSAVAAATPEPGSVALLTGMLLSGGAFALKRRRK